MGYQQVDQGLSRLITRLCFERYGYWGCSNPNRISAAGQICQAVLQMQSEKSETEIETKWP